VYFPRSGYVHAVCGNDESSFNADCAVLWPYSGGPCGVARWMFPVQAIPSVWVHVIHAEGRFPGVLRVCPFGHLRSGLLVFPDPARFVRPCRRLAVQTYCPTQLAFCVSRSHRFPVLGSSGTCTCDSWFKTFPACRSGTVELSWGCAGGCFHAVYALLSAGAASVSVFQWFPLVSVWVPW